MTAHVDSIVSLCSDQTYRGLVSASRECPELIAVVSDYREERGLPRLAVGLASNEVRLSPWLDHKGFEHGIKSVLTNQRATAMAAREKKFADARKDIAIAVGLAYHRQIKRLCQSEYGTVLYGRGGQVTADSDRYSKKWHRAHGPAKNSNGGARITGYGKTARVLLENHRGTVVATLPLPPKGVDISTWIHDVV